MNLGRISIRVKLFFRKIYDLDLLRKLPDYNSLLRLSCIMKFKTKDGWTELKNAIVDTGAHTTLIPLSLWKRLQVNLLADHHVRGLVPKEECKLAVKVGWVAAVIIDPKGNQTGEIKLRAFLASTDEIPIIVGFKDLLDKFKVCFDPMSGTGYIESDNEPGFKSARH